MGYGMPRNQQTSPRESRLAKKLRRKKKDLKLLRQARKAILLGYDQSYSVGGRQISRYTMPLSELDAEIRRMEDEIDEIEDALIGETRVFYHIPTDL